MLTLAVVVQEAHMSKAPQCEARAKHARARVCLRVLARLQGPIGFKPPYKKSNWASPCLHCTSLLGSPGLPICIPTSPAQKGRDQ
eukprot:2855850-Pyramimonas_sp.AAC.2